MTRLAPVILIALALAGCGTGSSNSEQSGSPTATTPTTANCEPLSGAALTPRLSPAFASRETMFMTDLALEMSKCSDRVVFTFEKAKPGPGFEVSYQPADRAKVEGRLRERRQNRRVGLSRRPAHAGDDCPHHRRQGRAHPTPGRAGSRPRDSGTCARSSRPATSRASSPGRSASTRSGLSRQMPLRRSSSSSWAEVAATRPTDRRAPGTPARWARHSQRP